ncbi:hypothetical protein TAMC210_14020 [Thermanaeromonas sp. C210]|nr:hypothetical protein TAMC210_14020 [Thermanaeromonas sp. C210]
MPPYLARKDRTGFPDPLCMRNGHDRAGLPRRWPSPLKRPSPTGLSPATQGCLAAASGLVPTDHQLSRLPEWARLLPLIILAVSFVFGNDFSTGPATKQGPFSPELSPVLIPDLLGFRWLQKPSRAKLATGRKLRRGSRPNRHPCRWGRSRTSYPRPRLRFRPKLKLG